MEKKFCPNTGTDLNFYDGNNSCEISMDLFERDFFDSLVNPSLQGPDFFEVFGSGHPIYPLADHQETLEEYIARTTTDVPPTYVPSLEDVFRPLSNATTIYPYLKKDPYESIENSSVPSDGQGSLCCSYSPSLQSSSSPQPHASPLDQKDVTTDSSGRSSPKNKRSGTKDKEKPSKRQKTQEEKGTTRAEQQRKASKRYRKKKKELLQQLEVRLAQLAKEKKDMEFEQQHTSEMIAKLKKENSFLRNYYYKTSEGIEKERLTNLAQLDELMRKGASDHELLTILLKIKECCKRISQIGETQSQMLVTPSMISVLARVGFFDNNLENQLDVVDHFLKQLQAIVKNLGEDQKSQLKKIHETYLETLIPIKTEREEVDQEISNFFKNSDPELFQINEEGFPKILHIMSTLECLRKNLSAEIKAVNDCLHALVWVLTPKQQAQFYLEAEFQHKSVIQLKSMWEAIKQSRSSQTSTTVNC